MPILSQTAKRWAPSFEDSAVVLAALLRTSTNLATRPVKINERLRSDDPEFTGCVSAGAGGEEELRSGSVDAGFSSAENQSPQAGDADCLIVFVVQRAYEFARGQVVAVNLSIIDVADQQSSAERVEAASGCDCEAPGIFQS